MTWLDYLNDDMTKVYEDGADYQDALDKLRDDNARLTRELANEKEEHRADGARYNFDLWTEREKNEKWRDFCDGEIPPFGSRSWPARIAELEAVGRNVADSLEATIRNSHQYVVMRHTMQTAADLLRAALALAAPDAAGTEGGGE